MFAIQSARFFVCCYVNASIVRWWEEDVSDRKEVQRLFLFPAWSVFQSLFQSLCQSGCDR